MHSRETPQGRAMGKSAVLPATSEYLTRTELHSLTDYARCAEQAAWLAEKNIPHLVDGKRVIVSRVHVMARIEGRIVASSSGLNLGSIK